MGLVELVVVAVWVMLPAYIPNNVAVVAGGGWPIDGGRTWRGRRLLGDGKTWRGSIAGVTAGVLVAALLASVHMEVGDLLGIALPTVSVPIMLAFPVGAVMGDMGASFVKRRFGRARGAAVPGLDQLDFLVAALVLGMLADPDWMSAVFDPALVVTVFVLTPVLHLGTNAGAYVLGLKDEPW